MIRALLILLLSAALPAAARNADGTLSLIERPNCGAPAITTPGGAFAVELRQEAELFLVAGEARHPLQTQWEGQARGSRTATCVVPADLAPGAYSLEAVNPGTTDQNPGVVHIVEAFPDTYTIAQMGDLNLRAGDQEAFEKVRTALGEAGAAGAAFAVVTGNLVALEDPAAYLAVVQLLSGAAIPVFTCPETMASPLAARYFGQDGYVFRFGDDGYLAFDTTGSSIAMEEDGQNGWLYRARRQIRDARWSIGLTQRYAHAMGMRAQLILFVDDPLDALLSLTAPSFEGQPLPTAPWGHTALLPLPDSPLPGWRLLQIGARIGAAPAPAANIPPVE